MRGIFTNDSNVVLRSLKLPQSNVNSDTTLTLCLQFVQNPGIFEGTLSEFGGFLLKLLDGTLVDTTALDIWITMVSRLFKSIEMKRIFHIPCRSSDQ